MQDVTNNNMMGVNPEQPNFMLVMLSLPFDLLDPDLCEPLNLEPSPCLLTM